MDDLIEKLASQHGRWRIWDDEHTVFTSLPELALDRIRALTAERDAFQLAAQQNHRNGTAYLDRATASEAKAAGLERENLVLAMLVAGVETAEDRASLQAAIDKATDAALSASGPATVKDKCAICGGKHDNDLLSDICKRCEDTAPWRDEPASGPGEAGAVQVKKARADYEASAAEDWPPVVNDLRDAFWMMLSFCAASLEQLADARAALATAAPLAVEGERS